MKLVILILFIFYSPFSSIAQLRSKAKNQYPRNLIANGSFEDINKCTEFEAMCEPEAWFYLPTYNSEPQGNDSNRYEVLAMTHTTYGGRSGYYIYSKLLCPLIQSKSYRFSIWINTPLNDFDHMDVYFSYQEPTNHLALNTVTDISFSLTEKYAEAAFRRWKKYSYTYRATGEERFITIGNFSNEVKGSKQLIANNKKGEVLYAIDNVTLYPLDNKESSCNEYFAVIKQLYSQNYRHPARLLNTVPLDTAILHGTDKKNLGKLYTKTDTLYIPDILFQSNSSKINPAFSNKLQALIVNLRIRQFNAIEIVGHTDNLGTVESNLELSLKRAEAIQQYISGQMEIPLEMIEIKGLGESQPKVENGTPEGRKINRRVEIILKS